MRATFPHPEINLGRKMWLQVTFIAVLFISVLCSVNDNDFLRKFEEFKLKYGKQYHDREKTEKLQNFIKNVLAHRPLQFEPYNDARYGMTKFWDLSPEEFRDIYLADLVDLPVEHAEKQTTHPDRFKNLGIPAKLDWRRRLNFSVISEVKNQRRCGACWAFSTVETVESMYAIQTGSSPPSLSVQEVIDCASNNYGCKGGDTCRALDWMTTKKPAIVPDSKYPLTDESNPCKIITDPSGAVYVQNYTCLNNEGQEDVTLKMLQAGPVAAAVDATTWYNYQGGIIQYHCGIFDNHAVQIIGYDLTGDVPHYIVRNSWGTDFGHEGYLYIKIGENTCGIASRVSSLYVKV